MVKENKGRQPKFTVEEDTKLFEMVRTTGKNWIDMAQFFPGRNAINLKNRYYAALRKKNLDEGSEKGVKTTSSEEKISEEKKVEEIGGEK